MATPLLRGTAPPCSSRCSYCIRRCKKGLKIVQALPRVHGESGDGLAALQIGVINQWHDPYAMMEPSTLSARPPLIHVIHALLNLLDIVNWRPLRHSIREVLAVAALHVVRPRLA